MIPTDGLNWDDLLGQISEGDAQAVGILVQAYERLVDAAMPGMSLYIDGHGHRLYTHARKPECAQGCGIHAPTDHSMRAFPTLWRPDRQLMERVCPHGVGHPDPDHVAFVRKAAGDGAAAIESVHGCDGCCRVSD